MTLYLWDGFDSRMNEEALVGRHIADWKRLEVLCAKADVRSGFLNPDETLEFVRLYRRTCSDLALVRTRSSNEPLVLYLNNLVGRAHGLLYEAKRKPFIAAMNELIIHCAQTMRRNALFFAASTGIFMVSWIVAWVLVSMDRSYLTLFGGAMGDTIERWKEGSHEGRSFSESIGASLMYAGNNPFVSIITGAIGAGTMGIYSIFLLYQNGAIIGALSSEMASVNKLFFLFSSIFPHGIPELTGIMCSGAAGLRFGWAILVPGLYSRGESLRRSANDGVTLIVMGVILCLIAAPIEGFFSFNPNIPQIVKAVFAGITFVMWVCFWVFYGRERKAEVKF